MCVWIVLSMAPRLIAPSFAMTTVFVVVPSVVVLMGFFIIVQVLLRGMTDSVRESINVRGKVVFTQSIPLSKWTESSDSVQPTISLL